MDQTTLVNQMLEDGLKLVNHLTQEGLPIQAAFWMKTSEEGQYYLNIVTPLAHGKEILTTYQRVSSAIRKMPQPFWVGPFDVKLLPPDSPIGKLINQQEQLSRPLLMSGSEIPAASGAMVEGFYPYPPKSVSTP